MELQIDIQVFFFTKEGYGKGRQEGTPEGLKLWLVQLGNGDNDTKARQSVKIAG